MAEVAADKWEFSLLVDQTSRILEARGRYEEYLGLPAYKLGGKHLASYFSERQRLGFVRYMARLLVRGDAEPVTVTLLTPTMGSKRFSMAAHTADEGHAWWLVLVPEREEKADATAATFDTAEQPFASEQELAALAAVHDHGQTPLDLTVFRAGALTGDSPNALPQAERTALDDEISETLLDHAHERLVTRPATGEYALLHTRKRSAEEIGQQLVSVASRHSVAEDELGLNYATEHVSQESKPVDLIHEARRRLREEGNAKPSLLGTPAVRMSAMVGGGSVALLLLVWLFVQISR